MQLCVWNETLIAFCKLKNLGGKGVETKLGDHCTFLCHFSPANNILSNHSLSIFLSPWVKRLYAPPSLWSWSPLWKWLSKSAKCCHGNAVYALSSLDPNHIICLFIYLTYMLFPSWDPRQFTSFLSLPFHPHNHRFRKIRLRWYDRPTPSKVSMADWEFELGFPRSQSLWPLYHAISFLHSTLYSGKLA